MKKTKGKKTPPALPIGKNKKPVAGRKKTLEPPSTQVIRNTLEPTAIAEDAKFGVDLIYSARSSLGIHGYEGLGSNVFSLRVAVVGDISSDVLVSLGRVDVFLIKVSNALFQGEKLFDVFDLKQELLDAGSAIFDFCSNDFLPSVTKAFPRDWIFPDQDIMLIHRIGISPLVRGQQLGLSVLARLIEDLSAGCSLVVIKPFPLQFEMGIEASTEWNDLALDSFSKNKKESSKKLSKYYAKLGFKKLGLSDHFAALPETVFSAVKKLDLQDCFLMPEGLEVIQPHGKNNSYS